MIAKILIVIFTICIISLYLIIRWFINKQNKELKEIVIYNGKNGKRFYYKLSYIEFKKLIKNVNPEYMNSPSQYITTLSYKDVYEFSYIKCEPKDILGKQILKIFVGDLNSYTNIKFPVVIIMINNNDRETSVICYSGVIDTLLIMSYYCSLLNAKNKKEKESTKEYIRSLNFKYINEKKEE